MTPITVDEMIEQVIELSRSHALWWYFINNENVKRFAKVEWCYPAFFGTILNSLRQSVCIILYQLFDKRRDVTSLVGLVEELNGADPLLSRQLQDKIHGADAALKKVFSLRHKVFAHRDKAVAPQAVFASVKLTPRELKALVRLAQDIVSTLAQEAGMKPKAALEEQFRQLDDAVTTDADNLMRTLKDGED
jgi:hypothetical protein